MGYIPSQIAFFLQVIRKYSNVQTFQHSIVKWDRVYTFSPDEGFRSLNL
jgi:hypothetical protein